MRKRPLSSSSAPPGYDLPAPNAGLPMRGRLPDYIIRTDKTRCGHGIFEVPGAPAETFLSPVLCERAMRRALRMQEVADAALACGALKPGSRAEAAAIKRLRQIFLKHVAVDMLADVFARLEDTADDLAKYYLAFRAAERAYPGRFPSPDEEEAP